MAMSEFQKMKEQERELDRKLDEICKREALERKAKHKYSYAMHTPREALRRLGDRSNPKTWL